MDEFLSPEPSRDDAMEEDVPPERISGAESFLIDIVIELSEGSTPPSQPPVNLREMWVFDPLESGPGRCFYLAKIVSGGWEVPRINVSPGVGQVQCVLKSDHGDIGFCCLPCRLPGAGYTTRMEKRTDSKPKGCFRTSDSQRINVECEDNTRLTISWRIGHASLAGRTIHALAGPIGCFLLKAIHQRPQAVVPASEWYEDDSLAGLSLELSRMVNLKDEWKDAARVVAGILAFQHFPSFEVTSDTLGAYNIVLGLSKFSHGLGNVTRGNFSRLQLAASANAFSREAAAVACTGKRADKAIDWLDRGRCFVWGQLGHLRTPFDRLREYDKTLAGSLKNVSEQLQLSAHLQSSSNDELSMLGEAPVEYWVFTHARLMKQWDDLVSNARLLPSFEKFLKAVTCLELLQSLPEQGPVVVINVFQSRCDAIALLDGLDEPLHIPLPDFSWEKAEQYSSEMKAELKARGLRMRGDEGASHAGGLERKIGAFTKKEATRNFKGKPENLVEQENRKVHHILGCLWVEVVKPILYMLAISKGDAPPRKALPRIWWCPTGPLSSLPIHAAGIYGGADSECLPDCAVSSYTPTVSMLAQRVCQDQPVGKATSGLFLTNQPKAPGTKTIPGTTGEVRSIFAKAAALNVRVSKAEGGTISPDQCLEYMKNFSSIHLACHASQHLGDPLKSRFKFHLGNLDLATIMQADLRHADFAFLSACETGAGNGEFSDEAFHLAAGILAAGYRRVVATMWSIRDDIAPQVANKFYAYLWSGGDRACRGSGFDGTMSAYALHHAIQELRKNLGNSEEDLLAWIPYVHFGY